MKAWWNQLQPRQQRLMLAAGVVILTLVLFVQVWEPMNETRTVERERIAQQQALHDWLVAVTPVATRMRQDAARDGDLGGRSLLGLADETARAAGLAGALVRIEPAGERQVRVWLEGAEFLATMNWLQQLSVRYPVEVSQLSVDRAGQAGQVNVRVTLASDA